VATGIQAKGLAEAKAIEEKAKAMKLLHEAGQQHEEFRLRLNKERDVELAAINVNRDIARAHSEVVGEALKARRLTSSAAKTTSSRRSCAPWATANPWTAWSTTARRCPTSRTRSSTATRIISSSQLAQWVKDFGIKTEDLKNLTIAALLGKMIASSKDSGLQSLLKSAHAMAKESGLSDVMASAVLAEKPAKV
jgi:flotillin